MTPLTPEERRVLIESLHHGGEALLHAVAGMTPTQWVFLPSPESWSVAQCCDHVEMTESFILDQIRTAGSEGLELCAGKDQFVIRAVTSRKRKVDAPGNLVPAAKYDTPAAFLSKFQQTRNRTLAMARDETANLRGVCAVHFALKELDGYQWLLMTSSHTLRHLEQIKEITTHEAYPR
jgi:hypothetical protein